MFAVLIHESVLLSESGGHRKWHFHSFKKIFLFISPPHPLSLLSLSLSAMDEIQDLTHASQSSLQLSSMSDPTFPHLALFNH